MKPRSLLLLAALQAGILEEPTRPVGVAAAQGIPDCRVSGWSPAHPVLSDSGEMISPSLAFRGEAGVLAGNSFRDWARWSTIRFRLTTLGGDELPLPEGSFTFARPRVVFDSSGRIHIFWAEPQPSNASSDTSTGAPDLGELYHGVYLGGSSAVEVNGRRVTWSVPRSVYRAGQLGWYPGSADVHTSPDGTIHLAFSVHGPWNGLVHIREGQGTRVITEFIEEAGLYPDLHIGADGRVFMAFIAPARDGPGWDANSVFFRRSVDGGRSWEPAVLVSRSGRNEAHEVRLVATEDGTLHLAWRQNTSGGSGAEAVWHSTSSDAGATWTRPRGLPFPAGTPKGLRAVAGPDGSIHAIVSIGGGGSASGLFHSRWDRNGWGPACVLDGAPLASDAELVADEAGDVHAIWNRTVQSAPAAPRSVALHARLPRAVGP